MSGLRLICAATVLLGVLTACSSTPAANPTVAKFPSVAQLNDGGPVQIVVNDIPVNPFLWQAAIETVAALPLLETDLLSGAIVSDWQEIPEASGTRYKITVLVLTPQLRADAVVVKVFKQSLIDQQWRDVPVDKQTSITINQIILSRAQELFVSSS